MTILNLTDWDNYQLNRYTFCFMYKRIVFINEFFVKHY